MDKLASRIADRYLSKVAASEMFKRSPKASLPNSIPVPNKPWMQSPEYKRQWDLGVEAGKDFMKDPPDYAETGDALRTMNEMREILRRNPRIYARQLVNDPRRKNALVPPQYEVARYLEKKTSDELVKNPPQGAYFSGKLALARHMIGIWIPKLPGWFTAIIQKLEKEFPRGNYKKWTNEGLPF